jgi:SAM-dependent methyltransferase
MSAVGRLTAAAEALAAVGARAAIADTDGMPAPVTASVDAVLAAAGVPDLNELPPPQRAMVAAYVRSAFGQVADLLDRPARPVGWSYTDPTVLQGQGRGSMMMPTLLAQSGEFGDVTSFLDVGTGVGWLAIGAAQVWPGSTIVGIDTWEPSLELARANVADAGADGRVELRNQNVVDLDDDDRFDLAWVPAFFLPPDVLRVALERVLGATRSGGQIAVARYNAPPDPLASATLRLRVIRDGGSWLEDDEIVALLSTTGWSDVRVLPKPGPTLTFIAARKA